MDDEAEDTKENESTEAAENVAIRDLMLFTSWSSVTKYCSLIFRVSIPADSVRRLLQPLSANQPRIAAGCVPKHARGIGPDYLG
jgi:hypothetical protein